MNLVITKLEEQIYNNYLKSLRKNQPYTTRKNFSNLSDKTKISLHKLKNFFTKFPHISQHYFFESFRFVYPNDNFPSLDFFTSRKAIKCYSLYKKHVENQSPDSLIDDIKKGLQFIGSFCIQNNITLEKYIHHKTKCMPTWTQHYRENKVNIYSLLCLDSLSSFYDLDTEEKAYWAPNLENNLEAYKIRFHNCKSKNKLKQCVSQINIYLEATFNQKQNNQKQNNQKQNIL